LLVHPLRLGCQPDHGADTDTEVPRAGLGAATWPLAASAQQPERMSRVAVVMSFAEDAETRAFLTVFMQSLAGLGWTDGRNLRIDVRWAAADVEKARIYAKELLILQPEMILAQGTPITAALQREVGTIPLDFVTVSDPVGQGFVASLARPGGNMTGFISTEAGMAGQWLELLTLIAPGVKHVAMMFNPEIGPVGSYYRPAFEAAARSLNVTPVIAPVQSDAEIETVITKLGREPGSGLVVIPDTFTSVHRAPIRVLPHGDPPA
jgi:putative tryptophan/tyrosine transport system substrate-binding protein